MTAAALAAASRKSSVASQHFTMLEIARRTAEASGEVEGTAPLAKHESLHSLSASKDTVALAAAAAADGVTDAVDSPTSPNSLKPRPYSEYNSESARFVPKLPPKKKVIKFMTAKMLDFKL